MPDPKDNAKRTGDTHPPEVEDGLDTGRPQGMPDALGADGTPRDRGQGRTRAGDTPTGRESQPAQTPKSGDSPNRDEPGP